MKRIYLSLIAVATIALLMTAGSLALFTAAGTNVGNTFTAGQVALGQPVLNFATVANIAPGDSGDMGSFSVTYTGLDAWLGLDFSTGTTGLFAGATPVTVSIKDDHGNVYTTGTNIVMMDGATTPACNPVTSGHVLTLTPHYSFPLTAGNSYQGASGTITMKVHAVQAAHNGTPGVCTGITWTE